MRLKREALHWGRGSVKTTLLFTLEESKMPLDPNAPKITGLVRDVCARVADKVWKAPTDGDGPLIDLLRKNAIKAKEAKFPLHYVSKDMVSSEPYGAAEVCLHSFAYDTGVCMSCGMSEASAMLAKKPKPAIPADTPRASWYATISDGQHPFASWLSVDLCTFYAEVDVNVLGTERFAELVTELTTRGIRDRAEREYVVARKEGFGVWAKEKRDAPLPANAPIDPAEWDKLRAALDKCEPAIPTQPMTKTEAQLHHLTSVLGSREKALDHWKECHLAERAKKSARAHADYNDSAAMTQGLYEHGRAQELEQAMNMPIAAEKSMRAQLLLREDD